MRESFTVKGILDKFPVETSFYFSALIPYQKMISLGIRKPGDWKQSTTITFVEAENKEGLNKIERNKKYLDLYNDANKDYKISSYHFQPLKTMHYHAYKVKNAAFNDSKPTGMITLFIIGVSILLLVYFNYMNISLASASERLREIGVRKVLGSNRKQIIFQFLSEHLLICFIAVGIGLLLAKFFFMPWFSQIANLELGQKLLVKYQTWVALVGLVLLSAISGAAYPAFYISSFKPLSIVKETIKLRGGNNFRKTLLGIQFFLTLLAISTAVAFDQETKTTQAKSWGYDPSNNLVVVLNNRSSYEVLKAELKNEKDILSVTGSVQSLGNFSKQILIEADAKPQTVQSLNVLPGFIGHLGLKILNGRDFSPELETDVTSSVLVNKSFLKQIQWTSGVGKIIEFANRKYNIIGEVDDFRYENFGATVGPTVIMATKATDVNFAYIKTTSASFSNAVKKVEKTWKKINPDLPFDYYYQDSVFNNYFNNFNNVSEVLSASSFIMILISMSGIFGLALLILSKKMKDISIRKVLGAGMDNISFLINKEFLFAISFAGLIGMPISWWIINTLFNEISPESQVSFLPLIFSFTLLLLITGVTVSWHIYKAYKTNPAKYLKEV